ncbi:hypothetical protein H696_03578 [Fonticula alba]|uniref:Uncharacterized protein n=1 Tax=Fonticula alba TaxID=691883 RepID=A0A058Z9C4_FONAL|nr:hypothetical protein H696_03578 [Fonticula alba]KCV70117.1 hypothetical protein H696_03578 [Fonticula alba]|eukprot:XP_009495723.1 hypothetical protein H696_03578 [Fonticula alba]
MMASPGAGPALTISQPLLAACARWSGCGRFLACLAPQAGPPSRTGGPPLPGFDLAVWAPFSQEGGPRLVVRKALRAPGAAAAPREPRVGWSPCGGFLVVYWRQEAGSGPATEPQPPAGDGSLFQAGVVTVFRLVTSSDGTRVRLSRHLIIDDLQLGLGQVLWVGGPPAGGPDVQLVLVSGQCLQAAFWPMDGATTATAPASIVINPATGRDGRVLLAQDPTSGRFALVERSLPAGRPAIVVFAGAARPEVLFRQQLQGFVAPETVSWSPCGRYLSVTESPLGTYRFCSLDTYLWQMVRPSAHVAHAAILVTGDGEMLPLGGGGAGGGSSGAGGHAGGGRPRAGSASLLSPATASATGSEASRPGMSRPLGPGRAPSEHLSSSMASGGPGARSLGLSSSLASGPGLPDAGSPLHPSRRHIAGGVRQLCWSPAHSGAERPGRALLACQRLLDGEVRLFGGPVFEALTGPTAPSEPLWSGTGSSFAFGRSATGAGELAVAAAAQPVASLLGAAGGAGAQAGEAPASTRSWAELASLAFSPDAASPGECSIFLEEHLSEGIKYAVHANGPDTGDRLREVLTMPSVRLAHFALRPPEEAGDAGPVDVPFVSDKTAAAFEAFALECLHGPPMSFSPDGRWLVVVSGQIPNAVLVWDILGESPDPGATDPRPHYRAPGLVAVLAHRSSVASVAWRPALDSQPPGLPELWIATRQPGVLFRWTPLGADVVHLPLGEAGDATYFLPSSLHWAPRRGSPNACLAIVGHALSPQAPGPTPASRGLVLLWAGAALGPEDAGRPRPPRPDPAPAVAS